MHSRSGISAKTGTRTAHPIPVAALVLAVLFVSGCGRLFGPEPAPTPEPATLRYVTLDLSPVEERLIENFGREYPTITIEPEPYQNLPTTYLDAGTPPDLMFITPGWFLDSAAETNQLVDLTDLWEQSGLNETFPPSVQALSERNGRQVYLPVGYSWTGLYYNPELFAALGIAPPASWDELMLAADTLAFNGITPFVLPGEDDLYTALWFDYLNRRLNGADVHRALMAGEIPFADARVTATFELWNWLFRQGYFNRDATTTDLLTALITVAQDEEETLLTTRAGMILADPNAVQQLPDALRGKLTVMPFPEIDPGVQPGEVVIATGYMVPGQAPHLNQALDYLNYVAGPDALAALAAAPGSLDAIPAVGLADLSSVPQDVQQMAATIRAAAEIAPPFMFQVAFDEQARVGNILRDFVRRAAGGDAVNIDETIGRLDNR